MLWASATNVTEIYPYIYLSTFDEWCNGNHTFSFSFSFFKSAFKLSQLCSCLLTAQSMRRKHYHCFAIAATKSCNISFLWKNLRHTWYPGPDTVQNQTLRFLTFSALVFSNDYDRIWSEGSLSPEFWEATLVYILKTGNGRCQLSPIVTPAVAATCSWKCSAAG